MTDIFSPKKRSQIMKKIGPKNSKQELFIRKLIFSFGYRYRLHRKDLPGKPDLVFPKYKKVIFINGCFWHHHNCKRGKLPETNREFWKKKILGNVKRDKENYKELKEFGWKILVVWQCEIKTKNTEYLQQKIKSFLIV
ncbi:MAG: DNA mismatch endonuclease Vsr [Candidatus Marinimicrobia bacterium]|nr:DNA mismatch endonuclease Vsr [Candidatus Neomarinimicrobiota bacterium]